MEDPESSSSSTESLLSEHGRRRKPSRTACRRASLEGLLCRQHIRLYLGTRGDLYHQHAMRIGRRKFSMKIPPQRRNLDGQTASDWATVRTVMRKPSCRTIRAGGAIYFPPRGQAGYRSWCWTRLIRGPSPAQQWPARHRGTTAPRHLRT